MQHGRRWLLGAGLGLSGLGLAASHAGARTRTAAAGASAAAGDFGIVPDTGRDVTVAVQAAIDRATERRVALQLAAGRYIVRGLELRPGTRLIGAGPSTVIQQAGGAQVGHGAQGLRSLSHWSAIVLAKWA